MHFTLDGCRILAEDKHTERPANANQTNFIPFTDSRIKSNSPLEKQLANKHPIAKFSHQAAASPFNNNFTIKKP